MRSSHISPQEQHIHYHYHYHYDQPQQHHLQAQPSHSPNKQFKTTSPRTYSSAIENNYWKRHVNPEVSKLYDNFQTKKSRFSENPIKISEDSVLETPRMPKNMLETECEEDTTFGERRPLSKLQSLYYQKRSVKKHINEIESITNETADPFCSIHEQKLRLYKKQIERLRRFEEECVYLRDNFMLHVQTRHKQSK